MTTPADIIAATRAKLIYERNWDGYGSNNTIEAPLGEDNAGRIIAALDAAGYTIVARTWCSSCGSSDPARPETCSNGFHAPKAAAAPERCPTCGSDDPADPDDVHTVNSTWDTCHDPWHGGTP